MYVGSVCINFKCSDVMGSVPSGSVLGSVLGSVPGIVPSSVSSGSVSSGSVPSSVPRGSVTWRYNVCFMRG